MATIRNAPEDAVLYDLHNTNPALYPNGFPPGPGSDNPNFPPGITTSIEFLRGNT